MPYNNYKIRQFLIKVRLLLNKRKITKEFLKYGQTNSIIYLPSIDWNINEKQRPQHISLFLSLTRKIVYGTVNFKYDHIDHFKKINKNLLITTQWDYACKLLNNSYLILSSNQQLTNINTINRYLKQGHKIIYDYVDEIHEEISGSKKMADFLQERHNYIKKSKVADLVLCVSNKLYQEMIKVYPKDKVLLVQNSVDYDHFQLKRNVKEIPYVLKNIIKDKKPIIGYYGALAKWIDYNLINETAQKHPEWNFVLIGVDYDKSMSALKNLNNIFFLGSKTYQELPKYGIWFDVAMIPFVRGEIAKSTSPLKFYEYMAMGKPTIITEDLEDCKNYENVFISKNDPDSFSKQIESALKIKDDPKFINTFQKIAKDNTWKQKAKLILNRLELN